ncbi:MAG: hypothetical protein ACFFGZ_15780 [Candidatus Thorarchaeota archaeon]
MKCFLGLAYLGADHVLALRGRDVLLKGTKVAFVFISLHMAIQKFQAPRKEPRRTHVIAIPSEETSLTARFYRDDARE